MNRLRIKYPQEFGITPMSYILPEDYEEFEASRAHTEKKN